MGDAATANMEPYMVAQGEGQAVWFLGTRMVVKATGDTTRGAFGLIEQDLPPGFATPAHVHHGEDEPFYVLQGEITFHAGEKSLVAGPGSFVFLPRGVAHRFEVTGSGPARLLQFNLPAGLEQFFVDAGDSAVGDAPPPDLGRVLALAGKYQFEILGPPPSSD